MLEHQCTLRVRYDECDRMGIVHHANYLKYFEIGRTELLRASGGCYREMEDLGFLVVVARISCSYRSPAYYDDEIIVHTVISKVTSAKIIHDYEIRRDKELLVKAEVTLAVIDREGRMQKVPRELIDQYESG